MSIHSRTLYRYLKENCGKGSINKRLPDWKIPSRALFDSLMSGDGTWDSRSDRNSGAYATTSQALADDVQGLAIALGYRAKITLGPPGSYGSLPVYRVLLAKTARGGGSGEITTIDRDKHITREMYTGKVWCFKVSTGVFVTRRNGIPSFQGNTAFVSYTVAEAQVFGPERMEFDEMINLRMMPELPNGRDFLFHSLPVAVRDVAQQLEAITLLKDSVEPGDLVESVNSLVGLELVPKSEQALQKDADKELQALEQATNAAFQPQPPGTEGAPGPAEGKDNGVPAGSTPTRKMILKEANDLVDLAREGSALMIAGIGDAHAAHDILEHRAKVDKLNDRELTAYKALMAADTFEVLQNDPDGMVELTGCVAEVRANRLM